MKVFELSKELNVTNKELIDFLKKNNYKVSSHVQVLTDEMLETVKEKFTANTPKNEPKKESVVTKVVETPSEESHKVFKPDDLIPCRSVLPWKLVALGVDRVTVYHWNGFGDVDYVSYKDLQSLRRTDYITQPKILIEDADLCYQWRRELGDTYKYFLGVEYPEELFDASDDDFEYTLNNCPDVLKDVIKTTAFNMMKNENYPSVKKLTLIDEILGTCLKDFL